MDVISLDFPNTTTTDFLTRWFFYVKIDIKKIKMKINLIETKADLKACHNINNLDGER